MTTYKFNLARKIFWRQNCQITESRNQTADNMQAAHNIQQTKDYRQQTANNIQQIAANWQQSANSRKLTAYQTADSGQWTADHHELQTAENKRADIKLKHQTADSRQQKNIKQITDSTQHTEEKDCRDRLQTTENRQLIKDSRQQQAKSIHQTIENRHNRLKVPKREIFDCSDFPDFYRIKSSWVGDLVVKILTYYFNFLGSYAAFSFWRVCSAWFEGPSLKFVIFTEGIKNGRLKNGKTMHMLSIRIIFCRICSACAPVACAYAQLAHQFLTHMLSIRIKACRSIRVRKSNFLIIF